MSGTCFFVFLHQTLKNRDSFLATLQNNIATVLSMKYDAAIEAIEKRLIDLQIQLLKLAGSRTDITQVTKEIYLRRDEKQKTLVEDVGRDDLRRRNAEMSLFLRKRPTVIKKYDENLVRRLIDKVTVHDDWFEAVFRSGVTVEVSKSYTAAYTSYSLLNLLHRTRPKPIEFEPILAISTLDASTKFALFVSVCPSLVEAINPLS